MPFTSHLGAAYNVEGSINDYFARYITAQGLPAWMPSAVVNYEFPDKPLTFPSWSLTHLGSQVSDTYEGDNVDRGWLAARRAGIVQIDAWVGVQASSGAQDAYVAQMRDMAARVFANGPSIPILDVYGSTAAPTANGTIIRTMQIQDHGRVPDPNPDVIRRRMTMQYAWLERITAV